MARFDYRCVEMNYLALDIGGANLKLADGRGFAVSQSFPLWKKRDQLPETLCTLLAGAPPAGQLAVTMTGELADCFVTKAEGVHAILDAVEQAAEGRQVWVYLCDGRLVDLKVSRAETLLAGASNWHGLAWYAGRFCKQGSGLLVDIGSTTSDIIPLDRQGSRAVGRTDPERLVAGELVYTGVERSPICAVVRELTWRGKPCSLAQEWFATTLDAYLLLEDLAEDAEDFQTADGRARTQENALTRMARMICADATMFSCEDAKRASEAVREAQLEQLTVAARRVLGRMEPCPTTIVLSGQGEFLARRLVERIGHTGQVVSLVEQLGSEVSRCACAHALATLARERAGV